MLMKYGFLYPFCYTPIVSLLCIDKKRALNISLSSFLTLETGDAEPDRSPTVITSTHQLIAWTLESKQGLFSRAMLLSSPGSNNKNEVLLGRPFLSSCPNDGSYPLNR